MDFKATLVDEDLDRTGVHPVVGRGDIGEDGNHGHRGEKDTDDGKDRPVNTQEIQGIRGRCWDDPVMTRRTGARGGDRGIDRIAFNDWPGRRSKSLRLHSLSRGSAHWLNPTSVGVVRCW